MKRIIAFLLCLIMLLGVACGCRSKEERALEATRRAAEAAASAADEAAENYNNLKDALDRIG